MVWGLGFWGFGEKDENENRYHTYVMIYTGVQYTVYTAVKLKCYVRRWQTSTMFADGGRHAILDFPPRGLLSPAHGRAAGAPLHQNVVAGDR